MIEIDVQRTAAEQRALMDKIAASHEEMLANLVERVKAVEGRLADYDSFNVLASLSLQNHLSDPDSYKETTHEGKSVVAEYATLLALKSPYSHGTKLFPEGETLGALQTQIEQIVWDSVWVHAAADAKRSIEAGTSAEPPSELEELQFAMRLHELGVRNPAYEHHHHQVLEGLFKPFKDSLVVDIGFSVEDAILLSDAVTLRMSRLFGERVTKATEQAAAMEQEVRQVRRRTGKPELIKVEADAYESAEHMKFVRHLAARPRRESTRFIRHMAAAWVFAGADEICSFTAEELADEAGVAVEVATAFVNALKIEFGDVPADFFLPSQTHPLRYRPVVHHAGRYLCPAPMLLDWAIQPALESALKKKGGSLWQRYSKHRHDWLLHAAVDLLRKTMPGAVFDTNLFYNPGGDSSSEAELDALGTYDSLVFLLEAKGMDVTESARRGAPDRLRDDLRKVVAKSHVQAVRAKKHLTDSGEARFRSANGTEVTIPPDRHRQVILISVSLAPLGHLTALMHAESELGLFKNGEYSWVVSIYDLMVIADMIDLPVMFPHYVQRRIHAAHGGFLKAHDELDLFAYYLEEGLFVDSIAPEDEQGRRRKLTIGTFTEAFDAYYSYAAGHRQKAAPRPTQYLPPKLRTFLERLEASALSGRVDAALAVLDLDSESRDAFIRSVGTARAIARRERRASNASLVGKGEKGWGLTYMCNLKNADELAGMLQAYCTRKQRELGPPAWIGLAELLQGPSEEEFVRIIRLEED